MMEAQVTHTGTGKPGGEPAVSGHGGASLALSDAVPRPAGEPA